MSRFYLSDSKLNKLQPDFGSITSIQEYGLSNVFSDQPIAFTSISFPELESVNRGMNSCFSRTSITSISFPKLEIVNGGMGYCFDGCKSLTGGIEFPSLTSVGLNGMPSCFSDCTGITSISFPNVATIQSGGMSNCFRGCTGLTFISFPSLTNIARDGMTYCFYDCTGITSISFPKLASIGNYGMQYCFERCQALTGRIDFPNLTSAADYGLKGCFKNTGVTEVHFKASLSGNSECTASNLGITGNVYFDL